MIMSMRKQGLFETSAMVKIGMLSGLGMVLMLLNFPLPIFPTFLKIDFSDAPALVGTFYMGPAAGVLIQLLKNILKVIVENNTGGVGELANFLVGTAYVIPLGLIYQKRKDYSGVLWGSILSVLAMTTVAGILNYYVFIPAFAWVMGVEISDFVSLAAGQFCHRGLPYNDLLWDHAVQSCERHVSIICWVRVV